MMCTNCNSEIRPATEYSLQIRGRDDTRKSVRVKLCELCATDFLEYDWIEHQHLKPDENQV